VKAAEGSRTPAAAAPTAEPPSRPAERAVERPRAAPRAPSAPSADSSDEKKTTIVPMLGLISGGGTTTWVLGGGVGFKPLANPKIRLQGDVLWHRYADTDEGDDSSTSVNVLFFSAVGHYLFGGDTMKPYVGGGLSYAYASCKSCKGEIGFQALGGVDYPMGSMTVRGEGRLILISGTTAFALLVGVVF
jgi:hypothetical protein